MRKVAVLTLNKLNNYGSQLQMYALMRTIEELGYACRVIDYDGQHQIEKDNLTARAMEGIKNALTGNGFEKRKSLFDTFRKEYINMTEEAYSSPEEMVKIERLFDKVVCGSDQIWNPIFTGMDRTYYLPFADRKKRIAYAASIGVEGFSKEEEEFIIPLVKQIPNLSVRESTAVSLLYSFSCAARHVLDPTMLLGPDDWKSISRKQKAAVQHYVLFYDLSYEQDHLFQYARSISKELGLKIISIGSKTSDLLKINAINLFDIGPLQFLWLIENASFVVTNSYHGMLFSVNYNKPFLVGEKSYGSRPISSRIVDFLAMVGLKDRIADCRKLNLPGKLDIDFTQTNMVIRRKRKESIDWLSCALSS